MILYHTSDREIVKPDIHRGRKNADFGPGFYLTPDKEFTYRWARKNAVVNIYEFDDDGLDVHSFKRDLDWFNYIFNNRRAKDGLSADVIIGPIANDTIFDTLGIMSSGFLSPETALELLTVGPEYTQFAIKSEKAAERLRFIKSEHIERLDETALKKEQEAFQEEFARKIEMIME